MMRNLMTCDVRTRMINKASPLGLESSFMAAAGTKLPSEVENCTHNKCSTTRHL